MIRKTLFQPIINYAITSWNTYPRTYKMFRRSKIYKNILENLSSDEKMLLNFVMDGVGDKPRPVNGIRLRKSLYAADLTTLRESR
jgi:hypothetical protein